MTWSPPLRALRRRAPNDALMQLDVDFATHASLSQLRHVPVIPNRLLGSSSRLGRLLRHNLLSVLVVSHPRWRRPVSTAFPRANAGPCQRHSTTAGERTEQSCRGWRRTRSTAASGTSSGLCTRRRRRRRRCRLGALASSGRIQGHKRIAADSTMLRMVKRFMALSLGVQRLQLEQRMGLTWPRPFLLRPLFGSSV
jgi:hypothetical protein